MLPIQNAFRQKVEFERFQNLAYVPGIVSQSSQRLASFAEGINDQDGISVEDSFDEDFLVTSK